MTFGESVARFASVSDSCDVREIRTTLRRDVPIQLVPAVTLFLVRPALPAEESGSDSVRPPPQLQVCNSQQCYAPLVKLAIILAYGELTPGRSQEHLLRDRGEGERHRRPHHDYSQWPPRCRTSFGARSRDARRDDRRPLRQCDDPETHGGAIRGGSRRRRRREDFPRPPRSQLKSE